LDSIPNGEKNDEDEKAARLNRDIKSDEEAQVVLARSLRTPAPASLQPSPNSPVRLFATENLYSQLQPNVATSVRNQCTTAQNIPTAATFSAPPEVDTRKVKDELEDIKEEEEHIQPMKRLNEADVKVIVEDVKTECKPDGRGRRPSVEEIDSKSSSSKRLRR